MDASNFVRFTLVLMATVAVWGQAPPTALERCVAEAQKANAKNPLDGTGLTKCFQKYAISPTSGLTLSPEAKAAIWQTVGQNQKPRESTQASASTSESFGSARIAAKTLAVESFVDVAPSRASSRTVPDAEFARVALGMAYSELEGILGKPYSRIEGDSLSLTYHLVSGKYGKIVVENRAVSSTRVSE